MRNKEGYIGWKKKGIEIRKALLDEKDKWQIIKDTLDEKE